MALIDKYGNTISSVKPKINPRPNTSRAINLLYNHPYTVYHAGDFRYRPFVTGDTDKTVSGASRLQYVNWSRQMFAQMAILDFAMELICDWAIGEHYDFIYRGNDNAFGNSFEDWINNTWANNCNILGGPAYNFRSTLKQIIREVTRDGDLLQVYTYDKTDFPKLQYVRTHRVIERNGIKKIEKGRFSGYAIDDGLIKNKDGTTIGYYIKDMANDASEEDDYTASIKDAVLIFNPKYFDKQRGLPALMPALLDAFSVQELDDAFQRRAKLETTLGVQYHNEYGEAPPDQATLYPTDQADAIGIPPIVTPPLAPPVIQPIIGGLQYVEMGRADIKSLVSNSPHEELTNYKDNLEQHVLSCVGVPHQLLFSPTDISRAPARGISEIFKKTISKTQRLLETFMRPAIVWAIGNAIEQGYVKAPKKTERWWSYIDFTRPAQFTLDSFNEGKQQMEAYKLGLTTRDDITTSQSGRRGTEVMKSRESEVIEVWSAAINAKLALDTMYQNNPEATQYAQALTVINMKNDLELRTSNPLTEPITEGTEND
jgi:hypothetical protein